MRTETLLILSVHHLRSLDGFFTIAMHHFFGQPARVTEACTARARVARVSELHLHRGSLKLHAEAMRRTVALAIQVLV